MLPIPENLKPAEKNTLNSFWPVRGKGNDYQWDTIEGLVLGMILRKQVARYQPDDFRADCNARFKSKLDNHEFWATLEKAYFINEGFFKISPLFLLFKAQHKTRGKSDAGASEQRASKIFANLLGEFYLSQSISDRLNFVEKEILDVLEHKIEDKPFTSLDELPYLPFLSKSFERDMAFLAKRPQYFLAQFSNALKIYAFSYCSQLSLNIANFTKGEPKSLPLYFLLDNERASSERTSVKRYGFKTLLANAEKVFPLLSALEQLQVSGTIKRPLWKIYHDVKAYPDQEWVLNNLNNYLKEFAKTRGFLAEDSDFEPARDVDQAFEKWKDLACEQFRDERTFRGSVNKRYVRALEEKIMSDFIQPRGSAGKTLVLNQDQLLLLTNLAIGDSDKLRLHELLEALKLRGFYMDNQSQQVLVNFYERMGNIERMSDSGDAVYVRKTI